MNQTTLKKSNSLRIGSVRVEVGDNAEALVDLGAMRNCKFDETWEEVIAKSDNAGDLQVDVRDHECGFEGELFEIDLPRLALIRGGLDVLTVISGELVTGGKQTVTAGAWAVDQFIKLAYQNGDGTCPDITEVKASVAGVLVEGEDYLVLRNERGEWGIVVQQEDPEDNLEEEVLTITSDYTPAAAYQLTTGGRNTINPNVVRLTNTKANKSVFQITIHKASNAQGISIAFNSDDSGELNVTPIKFTGKKDVTREPGDQLFEIYDSQGV